MAFTYQEEQAFLDTLYNAQHRAAEAFLQGDLEKAKDILLSTLKELSSLGVNPVIYMEPNIYDLQVTLNSNYPGKISNRDLRDMLRLVRNNADYLQRANQHLIEQLRIAGYYLYLNLTQPQIVYPGKFAPSELALPDSHQPPIGLDMGKLQEIAIGIYRKERDIMNKSAKPSETGHVYAHADRFDVSVMLKHDRTNAIVSQVVLKGESAQDEYEKREINKIRMQHKLVDAISDTSSKQRMSPQKSSSRQELLDSSGYNRSLDAAKSKAADEEDMQIRRSAKKMNKELSETRAEFERTGDTEKFFKSSKASIRKAEPKLRSSSSWKQILLDILSALIFVATLSLSYFATGRLRLFSAAEQKENIQELEHMRHNIRS